MVSAMHLALVAGLAQTLKQLGECDIKGCKLVSPTGFCTDCRSSTDNRQFHGQCGALVTGVSFLDDLDVNALDLGGQLVDLGDFLINILPETVRDGDVASAVVQLHGVLQN